MAHGATRFTGNGSHREQQDADVLPAVQAIEIEDAIDAKQLGTIGTSWVTLRYGIMPRPVTITLCSLAASCLVAFAITAALLAH